MNDMFQSRRDIIFVSWYATSKPIASHWYWHYKSLRELTDDSLNVKVAARKGTPEAKGHNSILPRSGFQSSFKKPSYRTIRKITNSLRDELQAQSEIFVFYEGGIHELALALELLRTFPDSRIVFNLYRIETWNILFENDPKGVSARLYQGLSSGRFTLSCELPRSLKIREPEIGQAIKTFPVFTSLSETHSRERGHKNRVLILESGSRNPRYQLESAFRLSALLGAPLTFLTNHQISPPDLIIAQGRFPESRVQVKTSPLDEKSYRALLFSSDVAVFFYDPQKFRNKTSGKLEDAIFAGCKIIVPENTGLVFQNGRKLPTFAWDDWESLERAILNLENSVSKSVQNVVSQDVVRWIKVVTSQDELSGIVHTRNLTTSSIKIPRSLGKLSLGDLLNKWAVRLRIEWASDFVKKMFNWI